MSLPGIGSMLFDLKGGSQESADKYYGREIKDAKFDKGGDSFTLKFTDGIEIRISDLGQACCEHRYMTCDDNPDDLIGGKLKHIVVKEQKELPSDDVHQVAFLEIQTDNCAITFCTHNEHNGYYGGFGLNISELAP